MATGYRLVNASDYSPKRPFADGVTTAVGSVSDAGGFWIVDPGVRWLGLIAYFSCSITSAETDVTTGVIVQVDYDPLDVIDTLTLREEWQQGTSEWGVMIPASPKTFVGKKITAGTVSDLYTKSFEFAAASATPEP